MKVVCGKIFGFPYLRHMQHTLRNKGRWKFFFSCNCNFFLLTLFHLVHYCFKRKKIVLIFLPDPRGRGEGRNNNLKKNSENCFFGRDVGCSHSKCSNMASIGGLLKNYDENIFSI